MMTKKFLSMLLAAAMCLSLAVVAIATDAPDTDIRKSDGIFISAACSENIDFKNQIWGQTVAAYNGTANQAEVFVSTDKSFAHVNLTYHGTLYSAVLPGQYTGIALSETMGYVGVYEGFLVPVDGEGGPSIPVIADITFTSEEMFTILTLGYLDDTDGFDVLHFGIRTQHIKDISRAYTAIITEKQETIKQNMEDFNGMVNPTSARLNATIEHIGGTSRSIDGYTVSRLSLFHAYELENGSTMPIYVKLNSNCEDVKTYIKNGMESGATFINLYPDTLYASINGRSNEFTVDGENYAPKSQTKYANISLDIVYYNLLKKKFDTKSLSFPISKVICTLSKTVSGTNPGKNIINWEIWENTGWGKGALDGDQKTETGFTVYANYSYRGNVSEAQVETFSVSGAIRYVYILMVGDDTLDYHIKTQNMTFNSSVRILP